MKNKVIILSEQKSYIKKGSSAPQIDGQERGFLKFDENLVEIKYLSFFVKNINRILKKIGLKPIRESFLKQKYDDSVFLYIVMNPVYMKLNLDVLKLIKQSGNKLSLYCYDCWQPEFDEWQNYFDKINPDYIFFGYKKSAEHFKSLGYNAYWIPLSADFEIFNDYGLDKTRLFMQMGRRNDDLHEKILAYLKKHNLEDNRDNYVYRKSKGEMIYPDIYELAKQANKTKYFVCVPKSYENFKRTGDISETICRYYEAMASKTMIIGMKPETFDELFPYKAMISFNNGEDFENEIDYYESHPEKYNQIIEKNYDCVIKNHSWANRMKQILEIINQ